MVAAEDLQTWPEGISPSLLEGVGTSGVQCNMVSAPHSAGRTSVFKVSVILGCLRDGGSSSVRQEGSGVERACCSL